MRVMLRPGEWDDLAAIADGWGVPLAAAGWAIVADFLGKLRGSRADLAEVGIALAAAQRLRPAEIPTSSARSPASSATSSSSSAGDRPRDPDDDGLVDAKRTSANSHTSAANTRTPADR